MDTSQTGGPRLTLVDDASSPPLPAPHQRECLFCFVYRMLGEHGCDGTLGLALHWQSLRAPAARGLVDRLNTRGGHCDCEIFMNGWQPATLVKNSDGDEDYPAEMPVCPGVRARSTQPCALWLPIPRPGYGGDFW